jgi:hypothetical protein
MLRLNLIFATALVGLLAGCSGSHETATSGQAADGSVSHVVLCWLKDPGNSADRRALIDAAEELRAIPGVLAVTVGPPNPSDRSVVDDSFDVGYVIVLESREALAAYLANPTHLKARRELLAPLAEKVVIYDIVQE